MAKRVLFLTRLFQDESPSKAGHGISECKTVEVILLEDLLQKVVLVGEHLEEVDGVASRTRDANVEGLLIPLLRQAKGGAGCAERDSDTCGGRNIEGHRRRCWSSEGMRMRLEDANENERWLT